MFRSFYWDIKMRNKKVISLYTLVWSKGGVKRISAVHRVLKRRYQYII